MAQRLHFGGIMKRVSRYKYRAKKLSSPRGWVYGSYFEFLPITPSPVVTAGSEEKRKKLLKHVIVTTTSSDWNMPREMTAIEIDKETVCQCIGAMSKKTVLYEEDIVSWNNTLYVIVWSEERFQFVLQEIGDYKEPIIKELPTDTDELTCLGNSYDNADILLSALDS